MLQATYSKYNLHFKQPGGNFPGSALEKETWFVKVWELRTTRKYTGLGECALFRGLSADVRPEFEKILKETCEGFGSLRDIRYLRDWSSIQFGLDTAIADLNNGGKRIIYPTPFTEGQTDVEINGLIWMGSKDSMRQQITKSWRPDSIALN